MLLSKLQISGVAITKLPITKIIGLIIVLQIGVSCAPIKSLMTPSTDSKISEVTDQFQTINDAITKNFLKSNDGKNLADLVSEGFLIAAPQPPQGTGSRYNPTWKTAPTGTNKNMEVEYIELLEVSDDFCKAWNNAKHPDLGNIIMPTCNELKAPYTCTITKPGVDIQDNSPTDQCGQTCCVTGNIILYRNGNINKKD